MVVLPQRHVFTLAGYHIREKVTQVYIVPTVLLSCLLQSFQLTNKAEWNHIAISSYRHDWVKEQLEKPVQEGKNVMFIKDTAMGVDGLYDKLPNVRSFLTYIHLIIHLFSLFINVWT